MNVCLYPRSCSIFLNIFELIRRTGHRTNSAVLQPKLAPCLQIRLQRICESKVSVAHRHRKSFLYFQSVWSFSSTQHHHRLKALRPPPIASIYCLQVTIVTLKDLKAQERIIVGDNETNMPILLVKLNSCWYKSSINVDINFILKAQNSFSGCETMS